MYMISDVEIYNIVFKTKHKKAQEKKNLDVRMGQKKGLVACETYGQEY